MKSMENKINEILFGKDFEVYRIENTEEINIYMDSHQENCECPNCGRKSTEVICYYNRRIQDMPLHNKTTWLNITVRKFVCHNSECKQTVFCETLPFAKISQVKTDSLLSLILGVSIFLSNTCASLILGMLGVKVSADSIKNIYDKIEIEDDKDIEEIGIDDVAKRKGVNYATVIYNLKTHKLIALLDGRDKEIVKSWLNEHKKIKKVARDRASAYAFAIKEVLPDCIQVADRFHLLQNLLDHLKTIFFNEIPDKIMMQNNQILDTKPKLVIEGIENVEKEKLSTLNYDNSPPKDINGNMIHFDSKKHNLDTEQYKKQELKRIAKQNKIIAMQEKYKEVDVKDYKEISKEFEISIPTSRKYMNMSKEEIEDMVHLNSYKKRKTIVDDYINIIYKMLRDDYDHNTIFSYIIYKGYQDDYKALSDYICMIAKNNFPMITIKRKLHYQYRYPNNITVIKKNELLKCILTLDPKKNRNSKIVDNLSIIKEKYPIVTEIEIIFKSFHEIIMGEDTTKLDDFVNTYEHSFLKSFCKGIKKDITAIKNAISYETSSGFVEGNNNKFKLIKRIVYGKMNLVNLFSKCWLAFSATKDDFDLLSLI